VAELNSSTLFFILAGGILPAVFWLWFWLREDKKRPEPRSLILLSFIAGGAVIALVLPVESFIAKTFGMGVTTLALWALTEEVFKLIAAYFSTWHRRALDEPVDYMIYMTTAALGFAAFENSLFILKSLSQGDYTVSLVTLGMRFVGATLLHVLASSIIGGIYALAYCRSRLMKIIYGIFGIILATALHTIFNYFIIVTDSVLSVFAVLWVGIVILLIFFEKVKHIVCRFPYKYLRKD